jgi:hypothetical protein
MTSNVVILRLAINLGYQPTINPPNGDNMANGAARPCFVNGHIDIRHAQAGGAAAAALERVSFEGMLAPTSTSTRWALVTM